MTGVHRRRLVAEGRFIATVAAFGWLVTATAFAQTSSSTSYVLSQATISTGGASAVSSSFVLDGSVSQSGTVGNAGSTSFALQSGFWTSLSTESILRIEGFGSGRGSVTGPGIACVVDGGVVTGDCTEGVADGTTLGVVAASDPANRFDGWTGCDSTSTSTTPGDTCQLTLLDSRTVTAAFTALGSIGDRVWRDVDGDGVQDAGEPGTDGVTVSLSLSGSPVATAVTAAGGFFSFTDVDPDTYAVSIQAATLPPGTVPTYDLDGVATPHTTAVVIADGQNRVDVDFGYQPLTDLGLTKLDSEDPLPGGQNLVYTLTVENLGPGIATGVTVSDSPPSGTTFVSTSGCAEDPAGVPTCTLGAIAVGASESYTLEVSIDPAPPGSVTNTATVTSIEVDLDSGNNSASESTELDDDPPTVTSVSTAPAPAGGELVDCATVNGFGIDAIEVQFSEPMLDPPGDSTAGDVTNPASWTLVGGGADAEIETFECGPALGDDVGVAVAVRYVGTTDTAVITPDGGGTFRQGLYRLIACGGGGSDLTDLAGNTLDGDADGDHGGDFTIRFRMDPSNLLANGYFDCNLEGWSETSSDPSEVAYSAIDRDGSADSGSAAITNMFGDTDFGISQCIVVDTSGGDLEVQFDGWIVLAAPAPGIGVQLGCTFFQGGGCSGATTTTSVSATLMGDTEGQWLEMSRAMTVPGGSQSGRCGVGLVDPVASGFEATVDELRVTASDVLFSDGFESGSTSAWTAVSP
jgi:uncharacterized repeat protein (TIGR01451 family)